ncbi:MAG: PadR family transcriptional regulator [Eubacteriaceae bacterium]|nr:PadR family transcriptional regulator [Eubacteriaceae bacterium]
MTEAMYYVLLALTQQAHGYKLMREITDLTHGRLNMGPGTLYGVLARMEKDKLITVEEDDGRRKVYSITDNGKEAFRKEYRRLQNMVRDGAILGGD